MERPDKARTIQIKTITQRASRQCRLVHALLKRAPPVQVWVLRQPIERPAQARQGDKGLSTIQRSLTKEEIQAGRIAVGLGQPQHSPGDGGGQNAQHVEDRLSEVLAAPGMVALSRQRGDSAIPAWQAAPAARTAAAIEDVLAHAQPTAAD